MKPLSLTAAVYLSVVTAVFAAHVEIATNESNINNQEVFNGGIFRSGQNTIEGQLDPRIAAGDKKAFTEIFQWSHDKKTGSFLGYNENAGLSLDLITKRKIQGVEYYELLLNVNEQGNGTITTFETFQIYTSDSASETGLDFSNLELDYDMDDPENGIDNSIDFSYELAGGKGQSGVIDLIIYVPQTYLTKTYAYINIGMSGLTNGWDNMLYFNEPLSDDVVIPEPATAVLMVLGGAIALRKTLNKS
ncbi:hypothetical protein SMSP2_02326 [Limihaloglobus sulfuriphilus]|uniref:PEP-CTERM protein-sorting domain-containing protein n=1 Tax=Limihaloglobus sulfuriphilus TaxID=1851148 RepID=A0A1Q2MI23_9BACT|nr:hypothetical protein [Limihaloglobus sulfuriphilus]AQQ71947.1 hypothetical protein SMSP2_02326 [Limihaloglobus sulfuriphilus]